MFYVEKKLPRFKKDIAIIHLAPTFVVFVAFMVLTFVSYFDAKNNVEETKTQVLNKNIDQIVMNIQDKMSTYEDIVRSGVGLFGASNTVTRAEWTDFISGFNLDKRYPGIQTIGYAEIVNHQNLPAHINRVSTTDFPGYTVKPEGIRSQYALVQYLEPFTEERKRAVGLDFYVEQKRREAMELAAETDETTVTDIVTSIQGPIEGNPSGFVMFNPIYTKGVQPQTPAERKNNLRGFIFAGFRSSNLLSKVDDPQNQHFGFQIYNGTTDSSNLLYKSQYSDRIDQLPDEGTMQKTFKINNKTWIISGKIDKRVVDERELARQNRTLWAGLLFSSLIAGFVYLLISTRTRSIKHKEQLGMQEAKDELLALASHQLRTPATGVKQYIGLLRDGYAGKLTKEQQKYVDKAYESNNRQLATINDMLLVAKVDANKIKLEPTVFDMQSLIRDIVDEQMESINLKKQNIKLRLPRKKIVVFADEKYVRMAIENIINNASKYTHDNGNIIVSLQKTARNILVSVADTGVGVEKDDFKLLFKKFSRIPNELTNKVSGSGIGLYLAKKIAEAHGGEIEFKSKPHNGSKCILKFPNIVK